jgi:hypothetical protein
VEIEMRLGRRVGKGKGLRHGRKLAGALGKADLVKIVDEPAVNDQFDVEGRVDEDVRAVWPEEDGLGG